MIKEEKILMPLFFLGFVLLLAFTVNLSFLPNQKNTNQYSLETIAVEELAHWIIQGRNDYIAIVVNVQDATNSKEQNIKMIPDVIYVDINQPGKIKEIFKQLPDYKKWIVIIEEGVNDQQHEQQLEQLISGLNRKQFFVLTGGLQQWREKIERSKLDPSKFSSLQLSNLSKLRPYFHKQNNSKDDDYITPVKTPVRNKFKRKKQHNSEEGC